MKRLTLAVLALFDAGASAWYWCGAQHEAHHHRFHWTAQACRRIHGVTTHGFWAVAVVLALACAAAPAFAQAPAASPSPAPGWNASLYTGALSVLTRGEKREYVAARAAASGPLHLLGLSASLRADVTGQQDGGGLDFSNPKTFRTIEGFAALRHAVGPIEATVVGGATFSIEGDIGRPVDSRLFTLAAGGRIPIGDGGYALALIGHHGPVGGLALIVTASIPVKAGAYTIVDMAFPLTRTVFQEKAWVLRLGASVRVKTLRLPF